MVDGTATRTKVKKAYEKALRDLENSRQKLEYFHQTDVPQYTSWLSTHFGALLTQIRELRQQIEADETLIMLVEADSMLSGKSCAQSYERIMKLRENPETPPSSTYGDKEDSKADPFDEDDDESNKSSGKRDPLEEFFRAMFGDDDDDDDDASDDEPWDEPGPKEGSSKETGPKATANRRLKELYRAVVRRLHPDRQSEMTKQKTEWWHQAQTAYEAGDVEQLEVILTLCEIGETGTTAQTSASLLQRITEQLRLSIGQIKRQLAEKRRDPAWNFSNRKDHDKVAEHLRRTFTADLNVLHYQQKQIQAILHRWRTSMERQNAKRSRNQKRPQKAKGSQQSYPNNSEFPF